MMYRQLRIELSEGSFLGGTIALRFSIGDDLRLPAQFLALRQFRLLRMQSWDPDALRGFQATGSWFSDTYRARSEPLLPADVYGPVRRGTRRRTIG